jgi:phosphate uptake regulator
MNLRPDAALADMARAVFDGVTHLRDAFAALPDDADTATECADAAIRCDRLLERRYRVAMSDLLAVDDLHDVVTWREMYRRYARLGDALVRVAERVWYATVKEG